MIKNINITRVVNFLIKRENYKKVLLLAVLFLSIYLRFYNLPEKFIFTIDEEYHTYLAQQVMENQDIKLIGVSISVGFYLGPLWTYLTAFLLNLAHNDPMILGYFAAFVGTITNLMVFLTGLKLFNFKVAILSSFLYAVSPLIVYFDGKYWNDTLIPLFTLGILYSLVQTYKSSNWWLVLSVIFGLLFHTHLSILPLAIVVLYVYFRNVKEIPFKTTFVSALFFLALILPIIVFGFTHRWVNIPSWTSLSSATYQHAESSRLNNVSRHANVFFQLLGRIWYLNPNSSNADETNSGCSTISSINVPPEVDLTTTKTSSSFWLSLLSLLLVFWFLIRRSTWQNKNTTILALFIIIISSFFLIFPGDAMEYYLLGIFPLLVFLPGLFIDNIKGYGKAIGILLVGLLVIVDVYVVTRVNTDFGMANRKELTKKVMAVVNNDSFEVLEEGFCQQYAGWRYIFIAYGRIPNRSSIDKTFGWIYPAKIDPSLPKFTVRMVEKRTNQKDQLGNEIKFYQGGFYAYVRKNY